jgi:hypothetical protein
MRRVKKMKRKENRVWKNIKKKGRNAKLALALAGSLLVSGPLIAKAEEKPTQRPPVSMKLGSAYDHKAKDFRAFIVMGSEIPLPLRAKLVASAGLAASMSNPGQSGMEEAKVNLSIPIDGPVWMDVYGKNDRHFAVSEFAVGGDVGVGLPFGAAIVGFEHIFDGGQRPLFGVLVLNAIKDRLSVSVSGGWVTNMDAGTAGGGVRLNLGDGLPALDINVMTIYNKDALLFADTKAMLEFGF